MKTSAIILAWVAGAVPALGQVLGPSFVYQGRLEVAGAAANGPHDLRFKLYDAAAGSGQVGPTLCVNDLSVIDGVFTVTLDFGSQFTGQSRFLEIDARVDAGQDCTNAAGFTTLSPRHELTAAPHAVYAITAGTATTATNATLLGGQGASFYQNASNLTGGTLPSARFSGTYSNPVTFGNPGNVIVGSGAGLTGLNAGNVSSGTLLNARTTGTASNLPSTLVLRDASGAFAAGAISGTSFAGAHSGDGSGLSALNASSISSGTLSDARLSGNVPLLNTVNNFTAGGSFGGALGLGTSAPSSLLELRASDPQLRVRNTNDPGGAVLLNTWGSLQLGLYNPTASPWGNVPANSYRAILAMDSVGRVGSATNTSAGPTYRNLLDDGSGNASVAGNLTGSGQGTFSGAVSGSASSSTGGAVLGTHSGTSLNQYGVFGVASATGASSAVGVRGESRGSAGSGVFGVSTHATGQVYGVLGLSSSSNALSAGVYGEHSTNNAVYGYSSSGRALFGRSDSAYGLYAQTTSGSVALYGVRTSNNNRGWFGGAGEGGWAESPSGTGFVARTTSGSYALYAERNPGGSPTNVNRGWFGGAGEGAWAESDQGNGLVALSRGLNASAVYCRNDAGGRALFADGVAAVRALDILGGADLAEPFDVSGEPVPGMVVAIDQGNAGQLRVSDRSYDTAVAGIISGANGLSPGVVMRDEDNEHARGRHPVAMTGRVWCYADATGAEIRPGDRLTTSDTPGHAMRVVDESRSPGTVIGKAMTPLAKGERGLVLVWVNLQ